jgi:hypothetical protein
MKIGDLVRNVWAVRTNPAVNESRGWAPIEAGYVGIVLDVRPDTLNDPPLINYVDVMLSVDGAPVRCGNYGQGHFEVIA